MSARLHSAPLVGDGGRRWVEAAAVRDTHLFVDIEDGLRGQFRRRAAVNVRLGAGPGRSACSGGDRQRRQAREGRLAGRGAGDFWAQCCDQVTGERGVKLHMFGSVAPAPENLWVNCLYVLLGDVETCLAHK